MGCGPLICGKQTYTYHKEQRLLNQLMSQFSHLSHCYSHDFVINCHKNMLLNPQAFLLKYQKKIQLKQIVPHTILEKWKLILYATNVDHQNYADCIGFDRHFEEQRISSKTYRFSKRNPFQIRLQDLYFHQSYKQIEKDAGRVYLVPQIKQDLFEKLLKKIANHFPESGYSLGVNYIIGYFLLVGMSQMDSFWMFVHLTLNQKFLALGFFQNDLPLTKVIIQIFKNLLRRKNKDLYQYIYQQLQVDDTSWILKWFTSCFLSTFPIQFCHYVLDFIFSFGILGLAVVAFAIVNFFQSHIYKCQEATDFFICLQQLFSFEYFSQEVHIQHFMSSLYDIALHQRDFDLLGEIGDNFYVKYFVLYSQWNFKHNSQAREKMNELLSTWYMQNKVKRETFTNKMSKSFDGKFYTQKKDDQQKMDDTNEPFNQKNEKIDATKDQKMQVKTHQHLQIPPDIEKKDQRKMSEKPLSSIQKARTIKISQKNIKFSVKSSSFEDENQSQKQAFQGQFTMKRGNRMKRPKSQKAISYKKEQMKKIRSQRRLGYLNNDKEKSRKDNITSIKSFVNEDNLSEGEVQFNVNPLNKQFSHKDQLSKTQPLRKINDKMGSLNFLQLDYGEDSKVINHIKMEEIDNEGAKKMQKQIFDPKTWIEYPNQVEMHEKELQRIWNDEIKANDDLSQTVNKQCKKQKIEEFQSDQNLGHNQQEANKVKKTVQKIQSALQTPQKEETPLINIKANKLQLFSPQNLNYHNQIQSTPTIEEKNQFIQQNLPSIQQVDLDIKIQELAVASNNIMSEAKTEQVKIG